jgi:hypothetical protein
MAHLWVACGGDGYQTWKVAADILSKKSWSTDKEKSLNLVAGYRTNNHSPLSTKRNSFTL